MNMDLLLSQIQTTVTLYWELLLCIAAASILGWLTGLMMQRSRHKKRTQNALKEWEERYRALDDASIADSKSLEAQLQSMAKELKSLQSTNRALTDTIKKNDTNIQQSRAEAIELNRQHTETHERLQRIIQQKDREIAELGSRLNQAASTHRNSDLANSLPTQSSRKDVPQSDISEGDLNNADTVAFLPGQQFGEPMDATVQMDISPALRSRHNNSDAENEAESDLDQSFDNTADLSGVDLEESTIVMDEEALEYARQSFKRGRSE